MRAPVSSFPGERCRFDSATWIDRRVSVWGCDDVRDFLAERRLLTLAEDSRTRGSRLGPRLPRRRAPRLATSVTTRRLSGSPPRFDEDVVIARLCLRLQAWGDRGLQIEHGPRRIRLGSRSNGDGSASDQAVRVFKHVPEVACGGVLRRCAARDCRGIDARSIVEHVGMDVAMGADERKIAYSHLPPPLPSHGALAPLIKQVAAAHLGDR